MCVCVCVCFVFILMGQTTLFSAVSVFVVTFRNVTQKFTVCPHCFCGLWNRRFVFSCYAISWCFSSGPWYVMFTQHVPFFVLLRGWISGWRGTSDCPTRSCRPNCQLDWNVYLSWWICGTVLWILCPRISSWTSKWWSVCPLCTV